jgi:hypothetical protein
MKKAGKMLACTVVPVIILLGAWSSAANASSTTTTWYRQTGSPTTRLDVVCQDHFLSHSSTQGVARIYADVYRTVPPNYAQSFAWRSWVQEGDGTWYQDGWHYGTIAAGTYNGVATQTWNVDVKGPRITSGIWAGDSAAHVAFEASVYSGGAWHSVGLNATSYGAAPYSSYFPACYI